jgi:hypothetical protein
MHPCVISFRNQNGVIGCMLIIFLFTGFKGKDKFAPEPEADYNARRAQKQF